MSTPQALTEWQEREAAPIRARIAELEKAMPGYLGRDGRDQQIETLNAIAALKAELADIENETRF